MVKSGVHAPERWEWSPLYFKEISWVGSNAFGVEEVDGVRMHGIAHYLRLASEGRIDMTGMLTHTFRLDEWHRGLHGAGQPGGERRHQGRVRLPLRCTATGRYGRALAPCPRQPVCPGRRGGLSNLTADAQTGSVAVAAPSAVDPKGAS